MNNLKISLILLALSVLCTKIQSQERTIGIVIHGGAGMMDSNRMSAEQVEAYELVLKQAIEQGYAALEKGVRAEEAVVVALSVLEDHPLFNAGKGSVLNAQGVVEMDASIMRGVDLNAGAVAGVTTVKHPIEAAAAVMNHSEHVMLSGAGALEFAKEQGLDLESPAYFITPARKASLQRVQENESTKGSNNTDTTEHWRDSKYGTVGAVALDQYGNLAAGTSTGGMTNKSYGRIGDSPIIGAGTYANNRSSAVSCTGHGEYFIRLGVAREVSTLMIHRGWDLEKAAQYVIHRQLEELGGDGGLIAMDRSGNISMPFNTSGMFRGYMTSNQALFVAIFR